MGDKVKVNSEELETIIRLMKNAYTEFSSFSQNGFQTEIEYLDAMNSDFVDRLTRILEIAKNWNIDRLNENINDYIQEAEKIYQEIKRRDETLAES